MTSESLLEDCCVRFCYHIDMRTVSKALQLFTHLAAAATKTSQGMCHSQCGPDTLYVQLKLLQWIIGSVVLAALIKYKKCKH